MFTFTDLPIAGLSLVERRPIKDERGFLERLFCMEEMAMHVQDRSIVQINRTLTHRQGTVRGMHFQHPPCAEMKFVTCIRGKVFDVALDLRKGSPTFLKWTSVELSSDNQRTFIIPEGFAHGFQTLEDECELIYFHTSAYSPANEGALNALDPEIGIEWPMAIADRSVRDECHPFLDKEFGGLEV